MGKQVWNQVPFNGLSYSDVVVHLNCQLARFGSNLGSYVWVSMKTFPERFTPPERGQHHAWTEFQMKQEQKTNNSLRVEKFVL